MDEGKRITSFNPFLGSNLKNYHFGIDKSTQPESERIKVLDIVEYVTVGINGDFPATDGISFALAEGYNKLKIISEVTETQNITSIPNNLYLYADTLQAINFSVANDFSHSKVKAFNINFKISGKDTIFKQTNKFILDFCEITGNNEANYFTASPIYSRHLKINTGKNVTVVDNLFNIDVLEVNYQFTTSVYSFITARGTIKNLITYGQTFNTLSDNNVFLICNNAKINKIEINHIGKAYLNPLNSVIKKHTGNLINLLDESGGSIYKLLKFDTIKFDTIKFVQFGSKFFDCEIYYLYYRSLGGGEYYRCKFTKVGDYIKTNYAGTKIIGCTSLNTQIRVRTNSCLLRDNIVQDGNISIEPTASKTNVSGNRTLTAIVDNGTNTKNLIDNYLI